MALYGNATDRRPRRTGQPCDVCGTTPAPRTHRHVADGVTVAWAKHAQNRVRVDQWSADTAGRPDLADGMLCAACYCRLISDPLNR